ncbi:MAG TPA: HAD-IIB family hydrolase [Pseudobdellovibrionaceae bacterium]|nr:HAD-IIB family hydrolase [Pseudobdellovibrionaceae bacterium]
MSNSMRPLSEFPNSKIRAVFSDIDDTITDEGQLHPEAYEALWKLHRAGIAVVPVTGRPAGWCEMIARFWPVAGVIGENGGFYFRYAERRMQRHFAIPDAEITSNRQKLDKIREACLKEVPGCAVASDQFSRLLDLAIDFAEDVGPLPETSIDQIVRIFERHGAVAKVSSIHVNGWFGTYDKLSMCKVFCERELKFELSDQLDHVVFCGDSPNDEPMFEAFRLGCAVANIQRFAHRLQHRPAFIASREGGHGFVEIAETILRHRR